MQWVAAMREEQKMFELTGSLHAAAIIAPGGSLQVVREDVGRHNAVDKVIGSAFLSEEYPLTDHVLVVSGRVSYEIVAKALRACMAGIVAVSGQPRWRWIWPAPMDWCWWDSRGKTA